MTALEVNRGAGKLSRRRGVGWIGLAPFSVYAVLFLGIPALLAIGSGFFSGDGGFTFANFAAFGDPVVLRDLIGSLGLSAASAIIGAVVGALVCYALLASNPDGVLRTVVDSASSVLAQFGGVMLAFAFTATIGNQGLIIVWLKQLTGDSTFSSPIYTVPGLTLVYLYFQIPLMVLTFMPAMEGLKPAWGEAIATLGGTRWTYWRKVGFPILAPAFFGCMILLFANSFSSFATAAVLISQGGIWPLDIQRALTSETVIGHENVAGVIALGMIVVMVVLMSLYGVLQRRAARWQR
ncbi:MAG TPA: ABC transporter permease [Pseudolysinimonas sp.]|nr:ABC transporter permease [Pseudolysinimonas sp.]